jgi:hypothetical protein
MDVWQAIAYVSSGVSLAAFLAAAIAWVLKAKSDERERLIRTANEADRAPLVRDALEFFHVDSTGLTKAQQFEIVLEQIRARGQRFRWTAAVICFLALLAAGVATFAIARRGQEGSSSNVPKADEYSEVARLRIEDLQKATRNVSSLLADIKAGSIQTQGPYNRVNDLNNNLFDLWLKIAGYGLGADPYLDNIFASSSAFSRAHLGSDYGMTDVPQTMGVPRLYERFLNSSDTNPNSRDRKRQELNLVVQGYVNPAIYPHRDFYERSYSQYRNGQDIQTEQFKNDLERIDSWLRELTNNLEKTKTFLPIQ